jgi:CheY-like chemotaxis protein
MTSTSFLYVEDDPMSREIMRLILSRLLGYEQVAIFENSQDFIEKLEALEFHPDVILVDIHMQPLDGFNLLKILRRLPGYLHTPVVALTASVMNEEVTMLRQAGFDGVIAKPVNQEQFPSLLERILRGEHVWGLV